MHLRFIVNACVQLLDAVDVLPHRPTAGRHYSWYLSGIC